jgi:hypothetical protein
VERSADLDDPVAMLEEHLAVGWEFSAEVVFEAGYDEVRRWMSPALGRLRPVDDHRVRLSGTTSNPHWYAQQLTYIPFAFEIRSGEEVRRAARELGRQLLAAGGG